MLWCHCRWTKRSTRMSPPTRDPHRLTYIKEGKTATYILLGFSWHQIGFMTLSWWWLQHRYVGPSQAWTSWSQMWLHICYLAPKAGEHISPVLASWTCPDLPDWPAPLLPPSWALRLADQVSEEAKRGPHFVSSYVISPLHIRQTDSLPVFKNILKHLISLGLDLVATFLDARKRMKKSLPLIRWNRRKSTGIWSAFGYRQGCCARTRLCLLGQGVSLACGCWLSTVGDPCFSHHLQTCLSTPVAAVA